MLTIDILLIILVSLFTFYIWNFFKKKRKEPKGFPPGPRSFIPLIGGMLSAGKEPQKYFLELRKKWGNIYSYDIGPRRTIIVNQYEDYKELVSRKEFNGRATDRALMICCAEEKPHGIVFNQMGQAWSEQRRFTMRNLRDFGFGRRSMESHLEVEIRELLDTLKSFGNKSLLIDHHFNAPVVNSVWAILLGNRFEQNDPIVNDFYRCATEDSFTMILLVYFPFLFKIYDLFPRLLHFISEFIANRKFVLEFMQGIVNTHKKSLVRGEPRDFIDRYLEEIEDEKDPKSSFYGKSGENNLLGVIHDLFIAGSETTSTIMGWAVHILVLNQKIQERVFQEINSKVGLSRLTNLADREVLYYTNATILEIIRMSSVLPLLPHEMLEDATYKGMFFPKGTSIFYNNYACLFDPEYWGDPEVFRPERFLGEDGQTLVKHEAFIPFHYGKRSCLGETLARDTLFLFITAILQRFKIIPDPSRPTPQKIQAVLGVSNGAVSFPIIFQDRLG